MRKREIGLFVLTFTVLLGALRQGREASRVRRGSRPPVYADTASAEPVSPLFAVPQRPRTAWGRLVAGVWSAPLTAVGLLLALAGGARPTYDVTRGCFVARGVGGVSAVLQRRVNADAHTLGQVVLCRSLQPSAVLLDHESGHVRQAERFGIALPIVYGALTATHGYGDNPFEVAARNFAALLQKNQLPTHTEKDPLDDTQPKEKHED